MGILEAINSSSDILYVIIRTFIIYIYAVILIRLGNSRFNFKTTFDYVLIITIGSLLARAINGSSSLLAAIAGSFLLVLLHWLFAMTSYYVPWFGKLVKGRGEVLIKDGQFVLPVMKQHAITEHDLLEVVREKVHENKIDNISEARIERTGRITFVLSEVKKN